ncbi:MAG TPA: hypothetical protein VMF59_09745 [Bacteroidota bacterium]|nr:hypothetical protein [Bacteroidota bacterium]
MTDAHQGLLAYYYFGFHSALIRYRALTMLGWAVTAVGAAGLLIAWHDGSGLLAFAVDCAAVVAGIALVQGSVAALDQYVRIGFPVPEEFQGEMAGGIAECARLMEEIDRGGWQEALAALRALRGMRGRYPFPPL